MRTGYKPRLGIVALLAVALCTPAAMGAELVLIENGQSDYSIVVPDQADSAKRTRKAAALLQKTLAEATGVSLPVVAESEQEAGAPALYLGRTRSAAEAGIPMDELRGWRAVRKVMGDNVYLAGEDGPAVEGESAYNEYLGTTLAVTEFLQNQVGARFLLPGPNGTFVPSLTRLAVDDGLEAWTSPRFDYVVGRSPGDRGYETANYYLSGSALKSYGGHSYYDAVPAKVYGKTHPEYFALLGGVRTPAGNHLCISNPEVKELMLKEMEKWLDAGYEWVELAQTDGFQPCGCDNCRTIHEDPGERTWIFHRELAEKMQRRRPGKKIMMIAYPPTVDPPTTFTDFPDNVVIQMCKYSPEEFDRWKPYGVEKTVYLYNWGFYHVMGFGPKRTPAYAAGQVKRFVESGVRGIYLCGAFECLGLEGPVYYVFGQTMRNPEANREDLLQEFYQYGYGKARAPMKAFFESLYERMELFSDLHRPNFRTERPGGRAFTTPEEAYAHFFPPKLLVDLSANLEQAQAVAEDPKVQARIRLVEREFEYVNNLATIFHLYRAYRVKPSWTTFDVLGEEIDRRHALLDAWYDDNGRAKPFDGWPRFFDGRPKDVVEDGGRMLAPLGAPVNWNTALLREKKILPGVGTKTARIPRVAGIAVDGRLDDAAWQNVPTEELNEIGLGELRNGTQFKMGYDDEAVYLGFRCALDTIDQHEFDQMGRDGKCFQQECLEVFLDPFGTREKYFQFILNPVPDSFYDARFGFIDDPIHPRYNKTDKSWNGEWDFAPRIDREAKEWTAEVRIPFATLGVEPPSAGASWTMNIGREEYGPKDKNGRHSDPTLSLWSPNLEAMSFHDRSTLGSLVFE